MVGWNIENETGPPWRNLEGEKLERAKEEYSIKLAGRKDSGEQQQHGTFECFLCAGTVLHTLHVLTCLIVRHLMKELHFTHAEPKAQRGKVACTGPQSQWIAFGGSIIKLMSLSKDSFCHNSFIGLNIDWSSLMIIVLTSPCSIKHIRCDHQNSWRKYYLRLPQISKFPGFLSHEYSVQIPAFLKDIFI